MLLNVLFSNKTRVKLLLKFFINKQVNGYLRGLASEFGDSTNSVRVELNKFEKQELLTSHTVGNKKYYQANCKHPHFDLIHHFILGTLNLLKLREKLNFTKNKIYLIGELAAGKDTKILDLLLIGEQTQVIDSEQLNELEAIVSKKVRIMQIASINDEKDIYDFSDYFILLSFNSENIKNTSIFVS